MLDFGFRGPKSSTKVVWSFPLEDDVFQEERTRPDHQKFTVLKLQNCLSWT